MGYSAYMPSSLLQNGLLEDALAFASLNHAIHLICGSFLSGDCVHSPLHNFPVQMDQNFSHDKEFQRALSHASVFLLWAVNGTRHAIRMHVAVEAHYQTENQHGMKPF